MTQHGPQNAPSQLLNDFASRDEVKRLFVQNPDW
jgi:hypothetical protein